MQPEASSPSPRADSLESSPPQPEPAHTSDFDRLVRVTDRLASRLDPQRTANEGGLSTGEVADLRRIDVTKGVDEACATFWRIVIEELESEEIALVQPQAEEDQLTPWLAILRTWAELAGLHRRSRPLGEALEAAHVSEMRLVRLLRSEGDELHDQLRKVAHQLRSAAEPVDFVDIANLVLSGRSERGETVRRRIASRYFRAELERQKQGQSAD